VATTLPFRSSTLKHHAAARRNVARPSTTYTYIRRRHLPPLTQYVLRWQAGNAFAPLRRFAAGAAGLRGRGAHAALKRAAATSSLTYAAFLLPSALPPTTAHYRTANYRPPYPHRGPPAPTRLHIPPPYLAGVMVPGTQYSVRAAGIAPTTGARHQATAWRWTTLAPPAGLSACDAQQRHRLRTRGLRSTLCGAKQRTDINTDAGGRAARTRCTYRRRAGTPATATGTVAFAACNNTGHTIPWWRW